MDQAATQEVARSDWKRFFDAFSRQHRGWIVTVEVLDEAIGDQTIGERIPLEGLTYGEKGGDADTIEIMLGGSPDRHVTHAIARPTRVYLDQSGIPNGAGEVLEIESAGGAKTLVRFHNPVLPEQLDGYA